VSELRPLRSRNCGSTLITRPVTAEADPATASQATSANQMNARRMAHKYPSQPPNSTLIFTAQGCIKRI